MKKIKIAAVAFILSGVSLVSSSVKDDEKHSLKDEIAWNDDFEEEPSIWESDPIEIRNATVQILDKVSGKVYREDINLNVPKIFGSIELALKRCFKNSPEDDREIAAFIEIREKGKLIFKNWLFASLPSVNLFSHPLYDVRVEFNNSDFKVDAKVGD